ncbi:AbrB/MazE/SpoVT family DNA-binding domain-containing protein [Aerophototrophica crusticola]|uniref:AbrB/MazE/SpoVT family DNA-binding domain-containing protein n=1 Tax=Aerophototrophica crusticola TaxID=1709002 RepID=A0A858R4F3_9PROT|nr:AbrB/MazE/SpoVT family DNA-binding domain-containing protein [Rhodospirillaceae bacterium B3]
MSHISMASNGRLVVPAALRAEMGLQGGGDLFGSVQDGKLVLEPYRDVLSRVRARIRKHIPEGTVLSDSLIQDRRAEAERE